MIEGEFMSIPISILVLYNARVSPNKKVSDVMVICVYAAFCTRIQPPHFIFLPLLFHYFLLLLSAHRYVLSFSFTMYMYIYIYNGNLLLHGTTPRCVSNSLIPLPLTYTTMYVNRLSSSPLILRSEKAFIDTYSG